jgi:hypothetical protein
MAKREVCMPSPTPIAERIWNPAILASEVLVLRV